MENMNSTTLELLSYLCLYIIKNILAMEYEVIHNAYLHADNINEYKIMSLQLCIRECEKQKSCLSVNFEKLSFTCSLYSYSHLQQDVQMINSRNFIYARLMKKDLHYANCQAAEVGETLSSGQIVCIPIYCTSIQPYVRNATCKTSFDPPTITCTCLEYNTTELEFTSTCVSGKSWSAFEHSCQVFACNHSIIGEGNVTKSSIYDHSFHDYGISGNRAWAALNNCKDEWIKVMFTSPRTVTGIVTKGRYDYDQWVESFDVYYIGKDGVKSYRIPKRFIANSDRDTKVTNFLGKLSVMTTGITIQPRSWYNHVSLRLDILGCTPDDKKST